MAPAQFRPAKVILFAVLSVVLTACSGYRPAPDAFQRAVIEPYRLGSGDSLRIAVYGQKDLTNTYVVDQAGYVSFPLIGPVGARGQTVQSLEGQIAAKLREGYLRDPDVSIQVDQYRSLFVMGEVNAPGQYAYVPGMTVQNAIATAGGFTVRANQSNADVTRKVNGEVMTGRVPISDPILGGDTIYIRERLF
jgi:polysaccharide export outer membrane protein